jgi:hypothetical protein
MVRDSEGEASVIEVISVDDLSVHAVRDLFRQARDADYAALEKELKKIKPRSGPPSAQVLSLRKRFDEIVAMDFFEAKGRLTVQALFDRLHPPLIRETPVTPANKKDFQGKIWMTRPRPGIDRVSSAWLISKFIDAKPRFVFADKVESESNAIPFDMYGQQGFGHEGDRCTFETLCRTFAIADKKVLFIAEAIHDADLEDHKYGREEGHVINRILQGWANQGIENHELLKRGINLVDGLYVSIV